MLFYFGYQKRKHCGNTLEQTFVAFQECIDTKGNRAFISVLSHVLDKTINVFDTNYEISKKCLLAIPHRFR